MHAGRAADRRIAGGDRAGALQEALERLERSKNPAAARLRGCRPRCRSWRRSAASPAPAGRPSPACRSPAPTGSRRRRSRRRRACPAGLPTVPKSNADLMAAGAARTPRRARHRHMHRARAHHLELGHPALRPAYSARYMTKERELEKLSDLIKGPDLIVAPVALNPIMAQMAALAGLQGGLSQRRLARLVQGRHRGRPVADRDDPGGGRYPHGVAASRWCSTPAAAGATRSTSTAPSPCRRRPASSASRSRTSCCRAGSSTTSASTTWCRSRSPPTGSGRRSPPAPIRTW